MCVMCTFLPLGSEDWTMDSAGDIEGRTGQPAGSCPFATRRQHPVGIAGISAIPGE